MSTRGSIRYAECKYASFHLYHQTLDDKVYMEVELGRHLGLFRFVFIVRMPRRIYRHVAL